MAAKTGISTFYGIFSTCHSFLDYKTSEMLNVIVISYFMVTN